MLKRISCFFIVLIFGFSLSSCQSNLSARDKYCNALRDARIPDASSVEKGSTAELSQLLDNFYHLKSMAPQNLINSWDIIISNTDAAIKLTNDQTLTTDSKGTNKYISAYRKILRDYTNKCN